MDMISIRRKLMARVESEPGIDTSPQILAQGKEWNYGTLKDSASMSATIIYPVAPVSYRRNLVGSSGGLSVLNVFKGGVYVDYWSPGNYKINADANGIAISIVTSVLDSAFMYIADSGDIIFAGRNSIYYGHRNINELN